MYEWDTPKAEQQLQSLAMRRELVDDLLEGSGSGRLPLKPEAVEAVVGSAAHTSELRKVRTAEELSVFLLELGDLSDGEIAERSTADPAPWLDELARRGTIRSLADSHGPRPGAALDPRGVCTGVPRPSRGER